MVRDNFKKVDPGVILSREDILNVSDLVIERVPVPEWGGDVFVRGMTGEERDNFESTIVQLKEKNRVVIMRNIRAKLCSWSVCDESGKRLFSQSDVEELAKKSAAALQRIFKVAQRLSGITEDDVNELAEGFNERPFEDSVSD